MSISQISDPAAIEKALAEFARLGRDEFLIKYGFGQADRYFLKTSDGRLYDSKAIVGAAYGYQFPSKGPLRHDEFSGGRSTVQALLERLGFVVVEVKRR